ncbi:MAG: 4-hydroxy-3-methylbut-2-enyl diphosphate reductase [Erysipelotrichaceae bacterium]|nr:4-hydroxy-3-methylbut-2-enyl diphosphate reductase [Erysipelotrichaceae bacterium]
MKVNKIVPQGYCNGVKRALEIVDNAINNPNTIRPIYLLGNIIHNKHVVNNLITRGVIVVEDKSKTRLELLDNINSGSVIFSAHGVSPQVYIKAKQKGLNIIDASCGNVLIVHKKITDYLSKGYDCIYIGTKNHPECEGILGINNQIHFISSIDDIDSLDIKNDKIYSTNQTTLSMYDIKSIFDKLRDKYPSIIVDDKICNATTVRQEAMANQEPVDLCIVVGDPSSSNTKKLAKVSYEKAKIPTVLCEDLDSLDKSLLDNVKSVSISSGASTPDYIVDEIIKYLRTK